MRFVNIYKGLEPGRYFDTVWVALPEETYLYLKNLLSPIKDLCVRCIGTETSKKAHTIPHITLRYLGYDSEELRSQIKRDKDNFQKAIENLTPTEIEVGEIVLYESNGQENNKRYYLNWKINNEEVFKLLHHNLLNIDGYSLFTSLEGENFKPHISLGEVDLTIPTALEQVKTYINSLPKSLRKIQLVDFGLNLASPNEGDNFRICLLS